MFEEIRSRRAARRVTPGDGRPLKRFRWWQLPYRSLFYLCLPDDSGGQSVYAVDVRRGQDQTSAEAKADLYLDGRHHLRSRLPAAFPVPGGTVEVRLSAFGLRRCHYVTAGGTEELLVPDRASAEGRRARFGRAHPALSRGIGTVSLTVLVVALVVLAAQLAQQITEVPAVAERVGSFTAPVRPPAWCNAVLTLVTLAAGTERALRVRYSRLLDGTAA
ncbi:MULTISPECIES: hypothetical protein [Streptomyces]|uniref:hypothetical protein n=1 Tax=Streptomyces TaxID=1883 RepID=UPI0004BE4523|nr:MULTISPECIES: hypothetical protein [Streptomyces]RAS32222.1 hypothetical protein BCL80_104120 [Streptomyces avidinii]SNX75980.1 hypothetical protein SAMN05421860_102161 [Streptomyces microflavus]MDX3183640.1 hypothetical protein [Streptomyces sp. ME02-7008A-1]MDX3304092.1 hypothetical protein [Streptomyces sp. ME02-7008A]WJY29997.1 hypothetical protein QTO28_03000 [Streptomyces sp. P9-2B-1]